MELFKSPGYTLVTKKGCPWSKKAKSLLKKQNIEFVEIQVHQNNTHSETWGYQHIKKSFKSQTFPVIYNTQGKKIGGYSDLKNKFK